MINLIYLILECFAGSIMSLQRSDFCLKLIDPKLFLDIMISAMMYVA